jgi:protein tyrosine phosphatase
MSTAITTTRKDGQQELQAIFSKTETDLRMEMAMINNRPHDASQVQLVPTNYLQKIYASYCLDRSLILSEAPTAETMASFLQMVYENSDAIFMLQHPSEINPKYANYPFFPSMDRKNLRSTGDIDECDLEFFAQDLSKRVRHYHLLNWPDGTGGTPESIAKVVRNALRTVRPVIHCAAGYGRSGTVAAVISAYRRVTIKKDTPLFLIMRVVVDLRKERLRAVGSLEQYKSVYDTLKLLLQQDQILP